MNHHYTTVSVHSIHTSEIQTMTLLLKRAVFALATACIATGAILFTVTALVSAQEKPFQEQPDSEVKAKYKNCEGGRYGGPRLGKECYPKS